jgi:hypothetical protein
LLTTAVLGSFARHGVVSGVASVAMYGLGMGVFVTALTVTLAFTKSGLLRASRTVMKVLDRVSSALVIFTGIYLTWYWYTAITGRLETGSIISRIGNLQNAVVTAIADIGAISVFFLSLLVLVMANQSWRLRISSILRGSASDISIGVLLMASVALMLSMSKPLLVVADFKAYLLGFERLHSAGQLLPGSIGDFSRSLGVSEYPGSLLFNLPWLLATSVSDSLTILVYGVVTSAALYGCVVSLGRVVNVPPAIRQSAAIFLPFIMFIPGPLMWNTVSRFDPAFNWMVSVSTLAVLPIAALSRVTLRRSALVGLIGGCFLFLSNIQFVVITVPVITTVILLTIPSLRRARALRQLCVFSISVLLPAIAAIPIFLGVYLFSVWRIPEIAISENVDVGLNLTNFLNFLLPMPRLGESLTSTTTHNLVLRALGLIVLATAAWAAKRRGYIRLATITIHSLWLTSAYGLMYVGGIGLLKMEIGLDPTYVQVFAYPIWILVLATATLTTLVRIPDRFSAISIALPASILLIWSTQWVIRNIDDRNMPAEYPIRLSATTLQLKDQLSIGAANGSLERTIIIQTQFPPEREYGGFRIRRSSDFSETFLMELSAVRIPVLNAYTHMISPITFELTNEIFSDGRPSWRQFSLYDRVNSERLADFGIRFVISEVPIEDSRLVLRSQEPFLAHGLFPTGRLVYLYEVLPSSPTTGDGLLVSIDKSLLRLRGTFQIPLERTIPVEFSNCLRVRNTDSTGSVSMSRGADSMLNVRLVGEIDAEIEYQNSIFQVVNCRIRDFFDYKRLTDEL